MLRLFQRLGRASEINLMGDNSTRRPGQTTCPNMTTTIARPRLIRSGSRCPTREKPPSESAKHNRRPSRTLMTRAQTAKIKSPGRRDRLGLFRTSSKVSKHLVRACTGRMLSGSQVVGDEAAVQAAAARERRIGQERHSTVSWHVPSLAGARASTRPSINGSTSDAPI
jgi:hypothetical protein